MKDEEAGGLVLQRFYDIRHTTEDASPDEFRDLRIDENVLPNIVGQLADENLVVWKPHKSSSTGKIDMFLAHIKVDGVKVVEGSKKAPIPILMGPFINQSTNVVNSPNSQVGTGNVHAGGAKEVWPQCVGVG
jgi:hypothetical protein